MCISEKCFKQKSLSHHDAVAIPKLYFNKQTYCLSYVTVIKQQLLNPHLNLQNLLIADKHAGRCSSGRFPATEQPPPKRHESKHEDYRYGRSSQESPWDDDYSNDPVEGHVPCAVNKRNWKRPSSASEMERKVGEIKSRHGYLGTGKST